MLENGRNVAVESFDVMPGRNTDDLNERADEDGGKWEYFARRGV